MRTIEIKWLLMLLCIPFIITSCDWAELPEYEEAEISAVQFYYRWAGDSKDPITGEPIMEEQRLNTTNKVNSEAGIIDVSVSVPAANGDFTEAIRNEITVNKLWGQVTISTAARIFPIEGSPILGTPGDWSKENKYEVMAGDGTIKKWVIRIIHLEK